MSAAAELLCYRCYIVGHKLNCNSHDEINYWERVKKLQLIMK